MKAQHRYPPYEHNFDDLCDGGCGRPVPEATPPTMLRRWGWIVNADEAYPDGVRRTCPVCAEKLAGVRDGE